MRVLNQHFLTQSTSLLKRIPLLLFLLLSIVGYSQQEAQFTQYMFNTLVYNPAYAGSKDHLSMVTVYRDQWLGWGDNGTSFSNDGRPITQSFSIHTPIQKRVGLGLSVVNDRTGARGFTSVDASYAYRIEFGAGTLSVGVQAGLLNWRANWDDLNFRDPRANDTAFNDQDPGLFIPSFGAGLYYYTDRFYAGFSIPHLANFNIRKLEPGETDEFRKIAQTTQHLYFTLGTAIPVKDEDLIFKPSILIKSVGLFSDFFTQGNQVKAKGAPTAFDLDLSLLFYRTFWLGASFNSAFEAFSQTSPAPSSHSSIDAWLAIYFEKGLRIGFAYDYPLNGFGQYVIGSFELMAGYEFGFEYGKMETPRYFR